MPYWFWCYNFVLTCCLPVLSGSWSSLPLVMSWCQPVSGHYPCQYWLIMNWFKTGTTTMPYWFWCYNFVLTCWDIRHPDKLLIECSGIAWPFTPGKALSSRVSNDLTLTWVWGCDCWVPLNGMAPGETPATSLEEIQDHLDKNDLLEFMVDKASLGSGVINSGGCKKIHAVRFSKSKMAPGGHLGFKWADRYVNCYPIYLCNTSFPTNFGIRNSFPLLFFHFKNITAP